MKKVSFCGESFLTADAAADALFQLVAALGAGHDSELLDMPAVDRDGKTVILQMIVGPTSELISVPAGASWAEPDTTEAVAYLRDRARVLSGPRGLACSEAIASTEYGWDDLYTL
jgi:hypothetical protein